MYLRHFHLHFAVIGNQIAFRLWTLQPRRALERARIIHAWCSYSSRTEHLHVPLRKARSTERLMQISRANEE